MSRSRSSRMSDFFNWWSRSLLVMLLVVIVASGTDVAPADDGIVHISRIELVLCALQERYHAEYLNKKSIFSQVQLDATVNFLRWFDPTTNFLGE